MIDRLLQNAITVILGTASFYLVAQNHLPDAFPALKQFSTISKYFIPLIFASNLSWTLLTNRLSGKSVQNQGFHYLTRVIQNGIVFAAALEFVQKTTIKDLLLINTAKAALCVSFVLLLINIRKLYTFKASRVTILRCGDPVSQTLIINGVFELFAAVCALTFYASLTFIFEGKLKLNRFDIMLVRIFSGTNLALAILNFSALALPDEDSRDILSCRKLQYGIMLIFMFAWHWMGVLSAFHTFVALALLLQLFLIVFPIMKAEMTPVDSSKSESDTSVESEVPTKKTE